MRKVHPHIQECILHCEIRVSGKFLSHSRASNGKHIAADILTSTAFQGLKNATKNPFAIFSFSSLFHLTNIAGGKNRRNKFLVRFGGLLHLCLKLAS